MILHARGGMQVRVLEGRQNCIMSVAIRRDGGVAALEASRGRFDAVAVWRDRERQSRHQRFRHSPPVLAAMSGDGVYVVEIGPRQGTEHVIDCRHIDHSNGRRFRTNYAEIDRVGFFDVEPGIWLLGKVIAGWMVARLPIEPYDDVQRMVAPQPITAVTDGPMTDSVALCGNKTLQFWTFWQQRAQGQWSIGLDSPVMRLSPDRRTLALASGPFVVLWDTAAGKQRQALISHQDCVQSLAFSADSRLLLTGSLDRTVKAWNIEHGVLLRTFEWPTGPVHAVAFAPDGLTAAAGGESGDVIVWDVD